MLMGIALIAEGIDPGTLERNGMGGMAMDDRSSALGAGAMLTTMGVSAIAVTQSTRQTTSTRGINTAPDVVL